MIEFYILEGLDYKKIGEVENGEIKSDENEILSNTLTSTILEKDENEIVESFSGPRLVAQVV